MRSWENLIYYSFLLPLSLFLCCHINLHYKGPAIPKEVRSWKNYNIWYYASTFTAILALTWCWEGMYICSVQYDFNLLIFACSGTRFYLFTQCLEFLERWVFIFISIIIVDAILRVTSMIIMVSLVMMIVIKIEIVFLKIQGMGLTDKIN